MKLKKRLLDNQNGTAMIEAALILPTFLLMTFAFIEIMTIFFYSFILENSMYEGTRLAKISEDRPSVVQNVRDLVGEKSFGLMDKDEVIITTSTTVDTSRNYSSSEAECTDTSLTCEANCVFNDRNGNGRCDNEPPPLELGQAGETIVYLAFYKKSVFTPMLATILNAENGEFVITSTTALRNEP